MRRSLLAFTVATLLPMATQAASKLQLEVYNPAEKAIFPVASQIISGEHEAVLIDAQFQRNDAQALVERIKAAGKQLTTVYISHSDPDYYFGLDVIQSAFPTAKIVATPATVKAIQASMHAKLAYWGPILKDNAPSHLLVPEVLKTDHLTLEGQQLQIKGLQGPDPSRSYVWIPSLKTVVGGVLVSSGIHVWMADTQSVKSRQDWLTSLKEIQALHPTRVVPGHFLGEAPAGDAAVKFTAHYLETFEKQAGAAQDADTLIDTMKNTWPQLAEPGTLEMSAKVIKGEMQWP